MEKQVQRARIRFAIKAGVWLVVHVAVIYPLLWSSPRMLPPDPPRTFRPITTSGTIAQQFRPLEIQDGAGTPLTTLSSTISIAVDQQLPRSNDHQGKLHIGHWPVARMFDRPRVQRPRCICFPATKCTATRTELRIEAKDGADVFYLCADDEK